MDIDKIRSVAFICCGAVLFWTVKNHPMRAKEIGKGIREVLLKCDSEERRNAARFIMQGVRIAKIKYAKNFPQHSAAGATKEQN